MIDGQINTNFSETSTNADAISTNDAKLYLKADLDELNPLTSDVNNKLDSKPKLTT